MGLKKNDFIKVSIKVYTLEGAQVENTTRTMPVGRGYAVKKLDQLLIGKQSGRKYTELIDKPFGNRVQSLIKLIPTKLFKRDRVNPYPGLVVNVDGLIGVVKSASPGRVLVDFNHPLAGKKLKFEIKIIKKITSKKAQAESVVESLLGKGSRITISGKNITVKLNKTVPETIKNKLVNELKEAIGLKPKVSLQ